MASFQFVQLLGAVVLVYHITRILYRLYWHPLAKFPGPRLAAATSAYEIYYDVLKRGQFIWELERLHKQYGPIVRINPHELHIKDPDYYDTIYSGAGQKRDKYDRWTMMAGAPGSAFSAAPHDLHRVRRAALNSFFAKRSVVRLEPRIADKVDTLCTRLADASRTGSVLELNVVFMALTMDVITEYCYGKSYNYLLEPDFKREWKETLEKLFEDAAFRRTVPWMTYMMQRIPQSYILKLVPNLESLITWEKEIYAEVKAIVSRGKGSSTDQEPESIFKELRDTELLPQSEKSVQRLADEGQVLIGAGAETTAKTLAYTAFYVLDTPGVLATLRNELNSLHKDPNSLTWTELEGLPYLTGVVKEGLRLSYGITTRLPRVPHESLQYREWLIPPRVCAAERCLRR